MSEFERKFVLKHTFSGVSKFEEDTFYYSERKIHFRIPWRFHVSRNDGNLASYLECELENDNDQWEIKVENQFKLIRSSAIHCSKKVPSVFSKSNGGWGWNEFLNWEKVLKSYVTDDKITMEIHVKILKICGFPKEKLRIFDEKVENLTDVVLLVEDRNFHVCKAVLANQSTYFNTLFFGKFAEAGKKEIELKDIDPDDFQDFLELIYGELVIFEENIGQILTCYKIVCYLTHLL